jgi:multidrug efflux pump subunit AcrB
MRLSESSLKNPAALAVVTGIVLLIGVVSIFSLPLQLLPDIDRPEISINATWRAAAPNEVEAELVQPIEQVMQGIPGLESLDSWSNQGVAWMNLAFAVGTDMNKAMLDVISRLNRLPPLPADSDPPVVTLGGFNGSAQRAVISMFAQLDPNSGYSREDQVQFLHDVVAPKLRSVPGVANIDSFGALDQNLELQIVFDPYRAANLGIDITSIPGRVGQITDVSGGVVDVGKRQYTLRFQGKYEPRDLENLIVDWRAGRPIRLGDFATVQLAGRRPDGVSSFNGIDSVYMRVVRASGANVMAVLNQVVEEMDALNDGVLRERGIHLARSFNPAVFIMDAIRLLTGNLIFGILLTIGALWWFLRKIRATTIIALTIPVSLLATLVVFSFSGRSINVISLAGLAFASGMVVDAAIVVLENIVRLREEGASPREASIRGPGQVWGALLASTATTVAIFIPVLFLKNAEGQLFADLAMTLAIAVTFSLLIAVTVLPVAAEKWMRHQRVPDIHNQRWKRMAGKIMMLTGTRKRQMGWIAGLILGPVAITYVLFPSLNYMPQVKADAVYASFFAPPATSLETMQREVVSPITSRLAPHLTGEKAPALLNYGLFTWGGGQSGMTFIRPADPGEADAVLDAIRTEVMAGLPDVVSFTRQGNLFGDVGDDGSVSMHLQSRDEAQLEVAAGVGRDLISQKFPGVFVQMDPDFTVVAPVLKVTPDDDRLLEAGYTRGQLGTIVRALGEGVWLGEYFDGANRLDIILKSKPQPNPEDLAGAPLVTPNGDIVSLGTLATVEREVGPQTIKRVGGRRTLTLTFQPPGDMALDQVITTLETEIEPQVRATMPADGTIVYGGSADSLKEAIRTLGGNFLLALVLLFMIMAALFRSIKDSFIVMISIPLATVGGVVMLRALNLLTFQPMDLLTMIGFIILLGLVVNNAILLVVETRRGEGEGLNRRDAVAEALRLRLRPIFMSTVTSIFGMLPLLLFPGEGSVVYRGMAAAIVGGMAVSTIFQLVLLPTLLQFVGAADWSLKGLTAKASGLAKAKPAR